MTPIEQQQMMQDHVRDAMEQHQLNRLETDQSLGYAERQAVDRDTLIKSIMRKYQLSPDAQPHAESYADELRIFSNPKSSPNQ